MYLCRFLKIASKITTIIIIIMMMMKMIKIIYIFKLNS